MLDPDRVDWPGPRPPLAACPFTGPVELDGCSESILGGDVAQRIGGLLWEPAENASPDTKDFDASGVALAGR